MRSRTIVVGLLAFADGSIMTFLWRDASRGGLVQSAQAQGPGAKPGTEHA